jgi:DNA repair exonuclease SbcCD nuclease subunit
MKFIFLSDLHLSLDKPVARTDKDFLKTQLDKLKFILDFSEKEHAPILQAGDFFHVPRSWGLLPKVWDLLNQYQLKISVVFGQHDRYMYSKDFHSTNLGILVKGGMVHLLDELGIEYPGDHVVFGCGYGDWKINGLPKPREGKRNILVIHREITDQRISKFQEEWITADEWVKNTKFEITVCGDVHREFYRGDDKHELFNCGPMIRRECSEDMLAHRPGFLFYDSDNLALSANWIEIPCEDADTVFDKRHIDTMKARGERKKMFEEFVNALGEDKELIGLDYNSNLKTTMKEMKVNERVKEIIGETVITVEGGK